MIPWRSFSPDQRFQLWLRHWHHFGQKASTGGQLAVLNTLAAMTPDSSYPLLDEIALWARMCHLEKEWAMLREAFERSLWPQLASIEMCSDEPPSWYTEAFYWLPVTHRRAALLVAFIDFMLAHIPNVDEKPFRSLQRFLAAGIHWLNAVDGAAPSHAVVPHAAAPDVPGFPTIHCG